MEFSFKYSILRKPILTALPFRMILNINNLELQNMILSLVILYLQSKSPWHFSKFSFFSYHLNLMS